MHIWTNTGTSEQINNVNIYNNTIGSNFGTQVTGWIYFEEKTGTTISNVNIYNNLLINELVSSPNGYVVVGGGSNTNVYNNTFAGAGTGNGVYLSSSARGVKIKNNIYYQVSFNGISPGAELLTSDYNIFYPNTSLESVASYQAELVKKQGLGMEANSIVADPLLLPTTYAIPVNSNAKWVGNDTGGQLSATDKAGVTWHSPPSMGAYEYVSGTADTIPPAAPSGLVVQ
jgi:hypothetical protein